jgi:hypothetical protein
VVKETDYFSRTDAIPDLGREASFIQAAFSLEPGQMSEVIRGEKGYYILEVIDRKAPETPPFEEVRDRVERQFRQEESRALAEKKAKEVLEAAASGTPVETLTEQEGIEAIDTGFISRLRSFIPRVGASEEILETGFSLTEKAPWAKQIFEVNGKYYVVRFQERREADREAFLAKKEELRRQEQARKAQEIYRQWLAELRRQQGVKISGVGA